MNKFRPFKTLIIFSRVITIPSDLKKKDALIKKAIIDDLNTTENPLWIEQ